jgi:hypothetical protein
MPFVYMPGKRAALKRAGALAESKRLATKVGLFHGWWCAKGARGLTGHQIEDVVEVGVLDSFKSVEFALRIALSHARAVLQTGTWGMSAPKSTR